MNTPEFRVSYPHVFEPVKNELSGKMEYSLVAIFPKDADLTPLKNAAAEALVKKFGSMMDDPEFKAKLRSPFRRCKERWKVVDGKQVIPAGYEDGDAFFITLKGQQRPGVVDQNVQDIIESRHFYSGCYAIASVNAYAYDNKGNRGASIGLGNLQKRRDGDPLGGRSSPTSDFKPVEGATPAAGAAGLFD